MKEIRNALESKDYEGAFKKSQKIQKYLMILEGEFVKQDNPDFKVLIDFFQISSRALKEVILKSDIELAQAMEKTFKDLAILYQEALERQTKQEKGEI